METYNDIFSNPKKIFEKSFKSAIEIKDSCIYVLDANVLLLPYTIGNKELSEIKKVYSKLLLTGRLMIPAQVAKEFAKNRPKKLEEINKSISDFLSRIIEGKMPNYPMLNQIQEYAAIREIETKLNVINKEYRDSIKKLLKYIKNLNWNDQVSQLYRELFSDKCVIDNAWDFRKTKDELETRLKFNLPPAFKDKSKDDGGIGDYVIWKDILKLGTEKKADIIFVTGDEKADWFHQSMNSKLYPRFELMHEFKEETQGKDIQFISLSELIEMNSDNKEVVENIKIIERTRSGGIIAQLRQEAIQKAEYRCKLCGFQELIGSTILEIHHIRPLEKGGTNTLDNIVVLCPNCHKQVHDRLKNESVFNGGSPCQMSGQYCPSCGIGIMTNSSFNSEGVECNICGLFIPS